jgi:hypothetical protein
MPAYFRSTLDEFLATALETLLGTLQSGYESDGFVSQYTAQTKAWKTLIPLFRAELGRLVQDCPAAKGWGILLEYPLYRLRKRIDAILLTGRTIVVLETKVGVDRFQAQDDRQVEDYALDLRDFHAASRDQPLVPLLWCTDAEAAPETATRSDDNVAPVQRAGAGQLAAILARYASMDEPGCVNVEQWDSAPYQPVPTIIQAATRIFAGHTVREITRHDAGNLKQSAHRIVELITHAKEQARKILVFLTGVPGAGKTLAGLQVVHEASAGGARGRGDIVYLSGNTPLVVVLREALARDTVSREQAAGRSATLGEARKSVRARIQHISDFLRQYLTGGTAEVPHEHAIVFDEAQRAWDAKYGAEKFGRSQSEPRLLLDIMGRHDGWCACICLVGGGQEINSGEEGLKGWGDALRGLPVDVQSCWTVFGPEEVICSGPSTGGLSLGELPSAIPFTIDPLLRLSVSLRSYRAPALSDWVASVLAGDSLAARTQTALIRQYPIYLTRSFGAAKAWLRATCRGEERRYGLLASSGARRLRADGLGVFLGATDGAAIAQWYLNDRTDIRSSYCLEVPANEYASQGLEIDHGCVCWGGDLVYATAAKAWRCRKLSGNAWREVRSTEEQRYIQNTYRVLLTRAREGIVLWVPAGDSSDRTRDPADLDATADFLLEAGASRLETH